MEVSIASDVYQGTYQYEELVDMQFVENVKKENGRRQGENKIFADFRCFATAPEICDTG